MVGHYFLFLICQKTKLLIMIKAFSKKWTHKIFTSQHMKIISGFTLIIKVYFDPLDTELIHLKRTDFHTLDIRVI